MTEGADNLASLRDQLDLEAARLLIEADTQADLPYAGYEPATFEDELAAGLSLEARTRLTDLKAAMERIDQGTYGTCDRCHSAIERRELDRHPWATECTRCQRPLISPYRRGRASEAQGRKLAA